MLHTDSGNKYATDLINTLETYTKSSDDTLKNIYTITEYLDDLNPVLLSTYNFKDKCKYWTDMIIDVRTMLINKHMFDINYDKLGATSITLKQLAGSINTAISTHLISSAFEPGSFYINKEVAFLIRYHKVILTISRQMENLHNEIGEMQAMVEKFLQENRENQITTLSQLPAILHKDIKSTKTIILESIYPQQITNNPATK